MIVLTATTDNLQAVLAGSVTTNQPQCVTSWRDITTTDFTPGRTVINTNNTTDVNIVAAPAASTQRVVDLINIYNRDTVAATITVKFDANGTEYILWKGSLAAGESVQYVEGLGWQRLSDTGKPQVDNGSVVSLASTTEVLTGTDTAKAVTPDALAAIWEKGSDIASSGTISIGEGGFFHVTGTTTITDIDPATDKAGRPFWLVFDGILTLTHHGTTLILPGAANIVTAAGDAACFVSEGSDAVRCVAFRRASGVPLGRTVVTSASATVTPAITDSGKQYRLTHGTPTFDVSAVSGPVVGETVFYVTATADVLVFADPKTVEWVRWDGAVMSAQSGVTALMYASQLIEVRYTATDTWTLSGIGNGA